ncbi:ATP-binding protein [Spirosoma sp. KNUC1025]|uniref:sensor histidine kinase n=1 Tax=Spirosoma sp. KNUC1025 TaxID=2894082 RepID=UPI003865A186|nr:PAS domain-containing protein [Spirosoma sp. KNUC1025]
MLSSDLPSNDESKTLVERLSFALQAAEVGTWDYNLETGVAEWSPICKQLFGLQANTPVTAAILLAQVHPDDQERVNQANRKAISPEPDGEHNITFRTMTSGGGQRWVQAKGNTYRNEHGQVVRFSGIVQDVSASVEARQQIEESEIRYRALSQELENRVQQRTQELLQANQDLQRSNDNLQQFAYVASHDLQEPLRKIQSFSTVLNDQYGTELGDRGRDLLQRMSQAGARMSTLIKDLLTYSRIATRQQNFGLVALDTIMANVLNTLEWEITQRAAQIEIDELPIVKGDKSQLGQLLQNLISNAIKFTPADKTPRIQIRYAQLELDELPAHVSPTSFSPAFHQISVIDEGVGFDMKYLDRIFHVFQRLHGRSEFPGTGVGLAICQRVVENHGGAITAISQPDLGATFNAYLPV